MKIKTSIIIGVAILLTTLVSIATVDTLNVKGESESFQSQIPVTTKQLQFPNGFIPVALRCNNGNLVAPNALDKVDCYISNNTAKNITALVVNHSIDTTINNSPSTISGSITVEILFDRSLLNERRMNFIKPNETSPLFLMPQTFEENQFPKGIVMNIDFIEFEDGTFLGENRVGGNLISQLRDGAMKYRTLISKKYKQSNKSDTEIDNIIQDKEFIKKGELGKLNSNQVEGARVFQKFLRQTYKNKNKQALERVLGN